ncbi:Catalyzes the phosphorylation of the 3'-hydroxyl group of dephosphocoenzyme A to form coenzyme A [Vibrio sp. B1FIG11]|uniref:dephospho-CoA kinase n=1 Tax=Vibrio TaxID=662 RepID=UPI0005EDFA14|nr:MULTISPECIES: dephospho-CoA kinase [Vibrio]AUW04026.1 dephospho-CoA kinase [Vibrio campbellii]MCC8256564.1 dephospho-CoA kinase [Vibrio campbellii CAIM 333]CAD7801389.1 Catalyzes the phosphorylation of the 3'-hydroxyl group of dephosphocoenzyme A to form coenzyme A [Vibrio sp. B1FIG11]CAE6889793.1 Catalyzes the phosphorylation of the 3'-hydroxyl group of dephosphocoenzyme A to form coenzyme A [Vibrio sp. B1FIG11]HDM8230351.1 dephospho-CoA kinase [Vibrio campbellii]
MAFVIGLTGGIASGKTTVANLFKQQFKIDIVDADIVAREVVEPGTPGLNAIIEHFGADIVRDDQMLDRAKLRERIFSNPEEKTWLNGLLHPMIREKMIEDLEQVTSDYALLVVPLLVENKLDSLCDRVLVVDVDPQTQVSRTVKRDNVSEEQAKAILASQASREQRLALADDVVKNNPDDPDLLLQITDLHEKYLAMCKKNLRK